MKSLLPLLFALLLLPTWLHSQQSDNPNTLTAPDGTTVVIDRDEFGVPHISGESEVGVFFGQGFAAAEDRLEQMDTFRRAAEGGLAEIFGTFQLESDQQAIREYYTPAERTAQFTALREPLRTNFNAYKDGVNAYIQMARNDEARFKPSYFLAVELRDWTNEATVAVTQFFMRQFGQFGGDELTRLQELQDNGASWFEENRPINDPSAFTTIPNTGGQAIEKVSYSGPSIRPGIASEIKKRRSKVDHLRGEHNIPNTFGSFATIVSPTKSTSGNALLLGAPQMGRPQESTMGPVHEVELIAPGFHVGGITVAGIPGIIIGHNEFYSWTMTSGISDNSDVFIEELETEAIERYQFNGQFRDFDRFETTIKVLAADDVDFVHYRSVHGPVIGEDLVNKQAFTIQKTFWNRELEMAEAFYDVWKGRSLDEFERAVQKSPMSFNVFYAGLDQNIKFYHIGFYPDRALGVDPRLPHKGDGSEEWLGLIPTENLPQMLNPDQGYFVNWNNKPSADWNNGDNIPWGNGTGLTTRVENIESYVSGLSTLAFDDLKGIPIHISDTGTYQQIIEWDDTRAIRDENIVPPGQSGFVDINFDPSPHRNDQWDIFINSEFKDMIFSSSKVVSNASELPSADLGLAAFPNPFADKIQIQIDQASKSGLSLRVYDLLGRQVEELLDLGFQDRLEIGASLPSGFYFVELRSSDARQLLSINKIR